MDVADVHKEDGWELWIMLKMEIPLIFGIG